MKSRYKTNELEHEKVKLNIQTHKIDLSSQKLRKHVFIY